MSTRTAAAMQIWRARTTRTNGDRAYLAYIVVAVAIVVVLPVIRAVGIALTSPTGTAMLTSSAAAPTTMLVVAGLWAGALLAGKERGPALLPPFPTHVLATSDLRRAEVYRGSVLRAGGFVTALTTLAAGLVGGALWAVGTAELGGAAAFVVTGTLVGVVTTVLWLVGQAFPRRAVPGALLVVALAVASTALPVLQPFAPWSWAGYPTAVSFAGVAGLSALAAGLVALGPALLDRLGLATLTAQAARWESATSHAVGMDFDAAASVYHVRPSAMRRVRAVRARPLWVMFLIRDAVGAARTPGGLVAGILAIAGAGALLTLAISGGAPLIGVVSGLVLFAGLGPLTDGVRHAASVASDLPLYGISDERLLASHALFPILASVVVLLSIVIVVSLTMGFAPLWPMIGALVLGALCVLTRLGNALKPPMSPALLAPIPTPMGDLGAAVRLTWALDAVLLAGLAGAAASLVLDAPVMIIAVMLVTVGIAIGRWRRRR